MYKLFEPPICQWTAPPRLAQGAPPQRSAPPPAAAAAASLGDAPHPAVAGGKMGCSMDLFDGFSMAFPWNFYVWMVVWRDLNRCCMDLWMFYGCSMDVLCMFYGCSMDVLDVLWIYGISMDLLWILMDCWMDVWWTLHGFCMAFDGS